MFILKNWLLYQKDRSKIRDKMRRNAASRSKKGAWEKKNDHLRQKENHLVKKNCMPDCAGV